LPQTNGIVERLHKIMLNEFSRFVFRKKTPSMPCRASHAERS
jgi:hypothetical protein